MEYLIHKGKRKSTGDFKNTLRYKSKGAWPLADRDQWLQVSDCAAETLRVVKLIHFNWNSPTYTSFKYWLLIY